MKKTTHRKNKALAPEQLYRPCDLSQLDFATTDDLADLADAIGQERASVALRFGMSVPRNGYNVFVLGPAGSGRHALIMRELESRAAAEPAPPNWCYVNNFEQPHKPQAISLPIQRGTQLQHQMRKFVEELRSVVPAAFESDEYHSRVEALNEEFKQRQEQAIEEFGQTAREQGVALLQTPSGFALAPLHGEEIVTPEEFAKLPDDEQKRISELIEKFNEQLHKIVHQFPRWRREHQAKLRDFNRETIALAVSHLVEELRAQYTDLPEIQTFLDAAQADLVENAGQLRDPESGENLEGITTISPLQRYQVNLLSGNGSATGAPVVYETHPTYQNLIGRIEHIAHMGTLVTNFTLIKPGALHRANGGYLVLDAGKLLAQPYAWEGLKRALLAGKIHIESLGEVFGLVNTLSLQPQPIPLNVKVVLFGERLFYYLLCQYDPDFAELFKVSADFEEEVERTPENTLLYARMIATLVRENRLAAFERTAVARLIEHGARMAGDSEKLLAHVRSFRDLLIEADHYARADQHATVASRHVQQAIEAQLHRADRLRQKRLESILDGTLMIDTAGMATGQVNGLAAFNLGNFLFAHPVRITATARLGEGHVVDIEREVELGGAIHSKGVMILSAFLSARYAHSSPLSLNASLVFEQSYGAVEGDSASLAELCALLSALAELPIHQDLALTGSVNQYGQAQAIGAVNEKIEGFFDVCNARGLSGKQGVLIPASNVKDLMLRHDVVEAVRAGRFHIHAVQDVDDAIELLTDLPAGRPDAKGDVPRNSVNHLVASKLLQLTLVRKEFGAAATKPPSKRKPQK